MLENIRLSFQGIWTHKLRSVLTMLGIIIGIAAIITIVSTIKGTNEQMKKNLVGSGNNTVKVSIYQDGNEFEFNQYSGLPNGVSVINKELFNSIENIKHIKSASLFTQVNDWGGTVFYNNTQLNSSRILGIDNKYFSTCGYVIKSGRNFTDYDYNNHKKVVIIDESTSENLFESNDPINKTIEINNEPFTVIGIVKQSDTFIPSINSIDEYYTYANNNTSGLYIPSSSWTHAFYYDQPQSVVVSTDTTDSMNSTGKEISDLLNTSTVSSKAYKYKSDSALNDLKSIQDISNSTNTQLIWIASISLLVGGIGVMNIMLVSVTERTREIGLKKAIGARKSKILFQFLTESMVLTSLGGIIGVLSGIGLSRIVSKIANIPVAISIPASIIAVAFSMIIGIIFGLIPSIQAAKLNPIDALRYE